MRVSVFLFFLFLFSQIVLSQNPYKRDSEGSFIVSVGDELPSFEFVTLNGDTLDSDFLRGQVCLIQFVASWCPYGRGQMKAVEDLIWRKFKKKYSDLTIVGFTEDFPQDTAQFRNLIFEKGISYPFCFDVDELVFKSFVTPHATVTRMILVDRTGRIVALEDEFYRKVLRRTRSKIRKMLRNK